MEGMKRGHGEDFTQLVPGKTKSRHKACYIHDAQCILFFVRRHYLLFFSKKKNKTKL